jgi:hypothetical protein
MVVSLCFDLLDDYLSDDVMFVSLLVLTMQNLDLKPIFGNPSQNLALKS